MSSIPRFCVCGHFKADHSPLDGKCTSALCWCQGYREVGSLTSLGGEMADAALGKVNAGEGEPARGEDLRRRYELLHAAAILMGSPNLNGEMRSPGEAAMDAVQLEHALRSALRREKGGA